MWQTQLKLTPIVVQSELNQLRWTNVALGPILARNQSIARKKVSAFKISSLRLQITRQDLIYGLSFNIQRKPPMPQKD